MHRKHMLIGLLVLLILAYGCTSSSSKPTGGMKKGTPTSTDNTSQSLTELRQTLPYQVFVPTHTPAGLVPQPPSLRDNVVEILYLTTERGVGLRVTNGQAGCCLDSDPRKAIGETPIRNGITGHFLVNQPEYGGPILWWQEAGTYVALSGPDLTKEDLVGVANSVSPTATLPAK